MREPKKTNQNGAFLKYSLLGGKMIDKLPRAIDSRKPLPSGLIQRQILGIELGSNASIFCSPWYCHK